MIKLSEMNSVTWYSRLFTILFIFGVFPIIVFFIGRRYQETVTTIVEADEYNYAMVMGDTYPHDTRTATSTRP